MAVTFTDTLTSRAGIQPTTFPPSELDKIRLGWNSRHTITEKSIESLAHEIASSPIGQITPGIVRKGEGGYAELAAGNRRVLAIKHINANLELFQALYPHITGPLAFKAFAIDCNVKELKKINLAENLDREGLSPIDKAFTVRSLQAEGWEDHEIAGSLRCSVGYLSTLRGFLSLPKEAQESMHKAYMDGEKGITGELGTALQGLPEEEIKKTVAQVERGEVKPSDAVRAVKAQKRERGVRVSMSLKEVKDLLRKYDKYNVCFDLLCLLDGEPTMMPDDTPMTFEQWAQLYDLEEDQRENGHGKGGGR